ncbi:hypothetical protein KVR01_004672 [Diaporthe batatas]|uniref:uncharacterized protein n=1 Tax=Diaporthe batatas TaxID=748121 RepID=UPI001D05322E|nr:uncharacterized protein KVR01_004672 [Diaporthe batatas]KAG8166120.1 hypothetical protein KVR01_004672 [Diaporthe batatas]
MATLDPGPLDLRCFSPDSRPADVASMLYNGISDRSRGWKSSRSRDFVGADARMQRGFSVKRWDGSARIMSGWDNLRKDPELWYKNGDCFVHLYEKGRSQRGPAFKVPFACLLSAQCTPLIEMFVDRSVSEEEAHQNGRVDLYIPAPPIATRSQSLQYHIATRNFFAWIFRRSMVGNHLGNALVALLSSMHEFRDAGVDNKQDLLSYLDEEGYLDTRHQPNHALAILHVAENFELRELYIDAFAHCVGMSEQLYKSPEYSRISVVSRKLIRVARVDLDNRLSRAGAMLGDLLETELSEAHLGLSTGARAHLDRFRSYIQGFYATKFGYFPPPSAQAGHSTIFKPEVYHTLCADFEALYEYLVDERFTAHSNSPSGAQGGLCTLQSVQAFDSRNKFPPLDHPLPLLPETTRSKESRRISMPWHLVTAARAGDGKLRPDQRLMVHAALMKATNHCKVHLMENRLVLAYRQFEESSVLTPHKANRAVSQVDARKVRWLFVYAMHQVLRSCATVPREVKFTDRVDYHLAVSTKGLPPWETREQGVAPPALRSASYSGAISKANPPLAFAARGRSISAIPLATSFVLPPVKGSLLETSSTEIQPDIDYFALTHRDESPSIGRGKQGDPHTPLARSGSRTRSLTRAMSLRRSLSIFRSPPSQQTKVVEHEPSTPTRRPSSRNSVYHEIVVQGYGNGTNGVTNTSKCKENLEVLPDIKESSRPTPSLKVVTTPSENTTTCRSASTSSTSSYVSALSSASTSHTISSASTTPTTVDGSPSSTRFFRQKWDSTLPDIAGSPEAPPTVLADTNNPQPQPQPQTQTQPHQTTPSKYDNLTFPLRRHRTRKSVRAMYSSDDMLASTPKAEPQLQAPPLPRRSSKRFRKPSSSSGGGGGGGAGPSKRWSLAEVVSSLRERSSAADSDAEGEEGEEATWGLAPSPLRITKAIRRPGTAAAGGNKQQGVGLGAGDDDDGDDAQRRDSSDEWEKSVVHSPAGGDVSPPWAWDQFADLGGLQDVSGLK